MNKNNLKNSIVLLVILSLFAACSGFNKRKTIDETPTSGNIKIAVDEAFQSFIDAELYTFEALYENAKVNPSYLPEGDAYALFMKDSVRLVVTSRKLTDAEEQNLKAGNIYPKTTKIAYDALTFIINKDNKDSLLLYSQIKDIFSGKIGKWSQLDPKSGLGDLVIVFDNNKSSNTRYVKEKFELKDNFPSYCFAVKSNPEVINYVEKNKNAIGIISIDWICDRTDTSVVKFLNRVKVVSVGNEGNTDGTGDFYKPYQGYIADGSYPLTREVYMISRETFAGLGTGFVSFVAGEKGQRIILKSGMVPSTMPVRLVQIKK
jgi:phosphate transport system substrate-binding protein